jgi:hypothetical protein
VADILVDENFPFPVVEELRRFGHDLLTASEAGFARLKIPDDAVLRTAIQSGRAVLTLNRRHFMRLHMEHPAHLGIIVCTFDPDFVALAERIHAALIAIDDLRGVLIRVNRPGPGVHGAQVGS